MGCGGSTPIDMSVHNAGMASAIGPVSSGACGLLLKQKLAASGDIFTVVDHTKETVFVVNPRVSELRMSGGARHFAVSATLPFPQMHITDPTGVTLAVLRGKSVYSYSQNYPGQKSTQHREGPGRRGQVRSFFDGIESDKDLPISRSQVRRLRRPPNPAWRGCGRDDQGQVALWAYGFSRNHSWSAAIA